ncbi:isopenicillin N synthase family oxygenase [Mesorhizobium sp. B3-1-7]|uniref:isopenicillin N synthase family dioxygenase n=1 Tax=Mesorhizobium sp. B3-1-7 TaxID=2589894 RepID=UPI0011260415|nr:2OG-Fe(II) oxygenase family protein [Mesorhizobium sp. B3-1-7]TPI60508.1 isopenicillin N synthase family oxygenase [Mesorhizobium sp. B3-1-7]
MSDDTTTGGIPAIDIAPLFSPPSPARDEADRHIFTAASGIGFMTARGFPGAELLTRERRGELLKIFDLPDAEKQKLLRWNFDPSKSNYYRGWFPLQPTAVSYKEGIDMGPDIAHADAEFTADDPLLERTPLPAENDVPGWKAAAAHYYRSMEKVGAALMASIARSLGLDDDIFDGHFQGGISTLRLIRYPLRTEDGAVDLSKPEYSVMHKGERRLVIGREHADSGFVTLLAQDGVEGLQARNHAGEWIDVPPADGTLAVNFGQLLERWTGGVVQATRHRVIAPKTARYSIPFFYEPRVDAEIAPLPIKGASDFASFLYGDYLWESATNFVEMAGVKTLRKPRRAAAA